jgi:N-acetylneuraminic acid mutarotase
LRAITTVNCYWRPSKDRAPIFSGRWLSVVAGLLVGLVLAPASWAAVGARSLSLENRVEAQRAIEQVFWNHRVWPRENPTPKPELSAVLSDAAIWAKVENCLAMGAALETTWGRPITTEQLQAEMNRMAADTRDPQLLAELFAALGNDPFVIAETLARQTLADRLIRDAYAGDARFGGGKRATDVIEPESWMAQRGTLTPADRMTGPFVLPAIAANGCVDDVWSTTVRGVPPPSVEGHTAVWTGAEMIVWGGYDQASHLNTGGRYTPSTDSWVSTSTGTNAASPRRLHSAVWTGTQMIIWGGYDGNNNTNSGARYDPTTDTWTPTSTGANTPLARARHTAVWTGTRMIVWGGAGNSSNLTDGGLYDPAMDTWLPTSTGTGCPSRRSSHTAVWTGNVMIVWGGFDAINMSLNTGGRYDPTMDTWLPTSTGTNVPAGRDGHTAVWTGSQMIVWGGETDAFGNVLLKTGGRYDPTMDTWLPTSTGTNVPTERRFHSAVWTGSEMIMWGGFYNVGGRYNPAMDSWAATSTGANVPEVRDQQTAVWTGSEMIIWGGRSLSATPLNSGGRYNPSMDSWLATSTAGAPVGRYFHTAVWTGTEMIVWGGLVSSPVNTGSRYSPSLDMWTKTSTASAPDERYLHTAIWTGTEMIVWGGLGISSDAKNTGGRYNPTADTWAPTSTGMDVPLSHFSHIVVWTGTDMIVWGGRNSSFTPVNTGGRYNPSGDTWAPTSTGTNVPDPRRRHTGVWTGTEMIVWGGINDPTEFNTGGRYNPVMDTWAPTSTGTNVPSARMLHTAVWTGTEMIIWSGAGGGSSLNSGGRYDPAADAWGSPISTGANVPAPSNRATAIWTGTEMIVWGGQTDLSGNTTVNTGGRYDPSMDAWATTSTGANVPDSRYAHTAVWTGTQMIVWGGAQANRPLRSGGRYCSPGTNDVPAAQPGSGLALLGAWPNPSDGRVLSVRFSSPSRAPTVLECFDVSGRRVASSTLNGVGPGVHEMKLGLRATLAPGVYLMRLTQDHERKALRVVVLD